MQHLRDKWKKKNISKSKLYLNHQQLPPQGQRGGHVGGAADVVEVRCRYLSLARLFSIKCATRVALRSLGRLSKDGLIVQSASVLCASARKTNKH